MPPISDRIAEISAKLPRGVNLVAVSKFQPVEKLRQAYDAGQRRFGESRADELVAKSAELPPDVEWHFIGHLQSNKVRRVVAAASVIQSIDSERLLRLVNAEAMRINRPVDVLLQVHVAAEETKTGFLPSELIDVARNCATLSHARIIGVMGMATNTSNPRRINDDFAAIARVSENLRKIIPAASAISMGMSSDWPIALSHGATIVRIGSYIFGSR